MVEEKDKPIDQVMEYKDEIKKCWDWYDADRGAKDAIQDELEECAKMYNGRHWDLKDPTGRPLRSESQKYNRPNTVENYIFSLVEGLVAEFSEEVDLIDTPVEPGDEDTAIIMTQLKKYNMYKNRLKVEREKFVRNFFLYGTGIWHVYWDQNWKGGKGPNRWVGDIRWKSAHPQAIYPDLRCRTNIEEGTRIHKAFYVATEYIEEKYGVTVLGDSVAETDIVADEERYHDGDSQEILLVETWYKGDPMIVEDDEQDEGHGLHVIWWAGEHNPQYLAHSNYVYFDPGEDSQFPFVFRARYPREDSVWGYGEAHFLKSPQIVLNKTTELILEGNMHFALGQTFYRPGAITPKQEKFLQKYGTLPNMFFPVNNLDDIKRIHGKGVDQSLMAEAGRIQRSMEGIIGRHDISQGRTPGSVVAFRALDLLAARARVRLRSAENAIISAYEDCGNYINNLIAKFYTEKRTYRILGDNAIQQEYVLINTMTGEERPFINEILPGWVLETRERQMIKYGTFSIDEHKKVYIYDTASGFGETFPYDEGMAEAVNQTEQLKEQGEEFDTTIEYEVYCPQLDVQCKVSSSQPTDRAFYMEMAKELVMAKMIDEETFWYVLQNGRFPPYETIMRKKKEEMQAIAIQEQEAAAMQQPQMGGGEMGGGPGATPEMLAQVMAQRPDLLEQLKAMPPEVQQQVIDQMRQGAAYF